MNRTSIEWVKNPDGSQGYTLNSKSGCENHTPEGLCLGGLFPCYAFKLANGRLKQRYLENTNLAAGAKGREGDYADPFYPRFWPSRLESIGLTGGNKRHHTYGNLKCLKDHKPKGIFLDDMSDWMLDCWPREWTEAELQMMRDCPWHRFYTLTKQPQNLPKFSPFPENCWVGVTVTHHNYFVEACRRLARIEATVTYISFEPLLSAMAPENLLKVYGTDWLIIGACTGTWGDMYELQQKYPDLIYLPLDTKRIKWTAQPKIEWVKEIVEAADKAGIPVFLKDNLYPLIHAERKVGDRGWLKYHEIGESLRQEMPSIVRIPQFSHIVETEVRQ